MWKIIYKIHNNFFDECNYATSEIREVYHIEGETKDEAEAKLVVEALKNQDFLRRLVEGKFSNTEEYEIIFSGEVVREDEIFMEVDKHPLVKEYIENRKKEIEKQKSIKRKCEELEKIEKEKEMLRRLKAKYEDD